MTDPPFSGPFPHALEKALLSVNKNMVGSGDGNHKNPRLFLKDLGIGNHIVNQKSLGIQSPCQRMSKGCPITSEKHSI